MLKNFAEAVLYGADLISPGEEGIQTLEMINGAYLSAWIGQKIRLPVNPEEYEKMLHMAENTERGKGIRNG